MSKRRHLEADRKRAILQYLALRRDLVAWPANTGAVKVGGRFVRFGRPGQADITGALKGGRRLEIEVKSPKGVLSAAQKAFRADMQRVNALYILAYSVDDVIAGLKQAKGGKP